jgi:uncharacterized protein
MLISFSVENWLSFKNIASLSMVAGREKQHQERVPFIPEYDLRLLPVAAVYGGNASGKTNLFKALSFAKDRIIQGALPDTAIPVEPFRLDPACVDSPASFVFQLLVGGKCYEFGFRLNRSRIFEEWLTEILKTTNKNLYHRNKDQIEFSTEFKKDEFLNYAFQGTRENQLFLTNAISQKVERFKPIYDWFRDRLVMIAPDSRFGPFEKFLQEKHPLYSKMNVILSQLDSGIAHLGGESISFDNLPMPENLKNQIQSELAEGSALRYVSLPSNERYIIFKNNGAIEAKKLVSYHIDSNEKEIRFDINQESDGTQRAIDLVPAFLELSMDNNRVFVIDELDRSLHTLLTKHLIESYLESCTEKSRSQLLMTTHDALLMDQKLFRRDEMFATERNSDGSSSLITFSDYREIRSDKDIRKSYLQGRLGGVPRIAFTGPFADDKEHERNRVLA